jgi:SAM-dependent methyltransferase
MSTTEKVRSTASSGSQVYESKRAVTEYLLFHYGSNDNVLIRHNNSPDHALNFLKQSAELCSRYIPVTDGRLDYFFLHSILDMNIKTLLKGSSSRGRALDIGCAVGGTSFELTAYFNEVVGIDYSNHFVDAANMMKERGEAEIDILKQGTIFTKANVKVSDHLDRQKASFYQGDACNLDPKLGAYI